MNIEHNFPGFHSVLVLDKLVSRFVLLEITKVYKEATRVHTQTHTHTHTHTHTLVDSPTMVQAIHVDAVNTATPTVNNACLTKWFGFEGF